MNFVINDLRLNVRRKIRVDLDLVLVVESDEVILYKVRDIGCLPVIKEFHVINMSNYFNHFYAFELVQKYILNYHYDIYGIPDTQTVLCRFMYTHSMWRFDYADQPAVVEFNKIGLWYFVKDEDEDEMGKARYYSRVLDSKYQAVAQQGGLDSNTFMMKLNLMFYRAELPSNFLHEYDYRCWIPVIIYMLLYMLSHHAFSGLPRSRFLFNFLDVIKIIKYCPGLGKVYFVRNKGKFFINWEVELDHGNMILISECSYGNMVEIKIYYTEDGQLFDYLSYLETKDSSRKFYQDNNVSSNVYNPLWLGSIECSGRIFSNGYYVKNEPSDIEYTKCDNSDCMFRNNKLHDVFCQNDDITAEYGDEPGVLCRDKMYFDCGTVECYKANDRLNKLYEHMYTLHTVDCSSVNSVPYDWKLCDCDMAGDLADSENWQKLKYIDGREYRWAEVEKIDFRISNKSGGFNLLHDILASIINKNMTIFCDFEIICE